MYREVLSGFAAFGQQQGGNSAPAGTTPAGQVNMLAYSAELADGRAGPPGRPASPHRVGVTLPRGRPLPRPADYGLAGPVATQRPYDLSPSVSQLHAGMAPRAMSNASGAATAPADGCDHTVPGSSAPSVSGAYMQYAVRGAGASHVSPSGPHSVTGPSLDSDGSMEDGDDGTPCASIGTSLPRPMAGATVCRPTPPPRRPRSTQCRPPLGPSTARRSSQSPSTTRARRASPSRCGSPAAGAVGMAAAGRGSLSRGCSGDAPAAGLATAPPSDSGATAAQVANLSRSSMLGFSGVRREITAQRKELSIMNNQQRTLIKKINDIAVLADRLTSTVTFQRHALHDMSNDLSALLTEVRSARSSATASPLGTAAVATAAPQSQVEMEMQDAKWVLELRPHIIKFLTEMFTTARDAADVWAEMQRVHEFSQRWTASRLNVDVNAARALLERRWRLPQRAGRKSAVAPATDEVSARLMVYRNMTMGFRYVNRAVSHFYQKLGNKAVSAFLTVVNDSESVGSLRRLRGTQTKYEVILSPAEASPLLVGNAFITEHKFHLAVIQALVVVFSTFGVLSRFSEDGPVAGGPRVIACRTAHLALVTMKIRQHIKMRAAVTSNDGAPAVSVPVLNAGHRAEWVEELATVSDIFAAQSDRPCNGLRLTDGKDPHRADAAHRTLKADADTAGAVGAGAPAAAEEHDAETAAALGAWRSIAGNDDDEASNGGDGDGNDEDVDAAADSARDAARWSLELESVD